MDETYINVKSEWVYLCRADDKLGEDCPATIPLKSAAPIKIWAQFALGLGLPRQ
jgi:hypothetical protein